MGDLAVGALFDDDGGRFRGAVWVLFLDGVPGDCPTDEDGRVTICHVPPGNPNNAHTIIVNAKAVPAHLAHGDACGPCEGGGALLMADDGVACSADLNVDDVVDASDLAVLLGSWAPCPGCPADLFVDGIVDASDLATLLGNWGPCE